MDKDQVIGRVETENKKDETEEKVLSKKVSRPLEMSIDDFLEEYHARLAFDVTALDEALIEQPQLYYDVVERLSYEISRRDSAQLHVAVVDAEVDTFYREEAIKENRKTTERELESKRIQNKDVKKAKKQLFEISEKVKNLEGLRDAYQQRSYAIREIAQLWSSGYFTTDFVSQPHKESSDVKAAKSRVVREKLKKVRQSSKK